MQWYLGVVRDNYANFSGRARRREYWMFNLVNLIIMIGLLIFWMIAGAVMKSMGMAVLGIVVYSFYSLALLIPSLAVTVRRLHDVGKSGWWILISCVPVIGGIWFLILVCTDSNPGKNEYGLSPKETVAELQGL